ncbi:DUF1684 domain-containing protein [Hymenobacter properus]|uniref:DUF1684 domain-containing protein n=1 Tax=Hymenobacter properus TaxID=2791026 RepID=A0A931BK45_9BACT|nr:DUF1684 domain-containing protein [Hymenobacter properus]MBF9143723.1 DUF1684 domain-containing protein [Hymenobacter properus]MBR7722536.1 DUF1684 domain-containing protein [Microvirga sp. SRT04]
MIKKLALAAALIGIIWYSLNDAKPNNSAYLAQLNKFRRDKNLSFRQSEESPLPAAQKAAFDSLKYYPGDPTFVPHADIARNATPDTTLLQMSDNKAEKYLNWGVVKFSINNSPQQLRLYLKANGRDSTLFIPFTDLTNGHETYGGGRYLDAPLPLLNESEITLDFNRAYNPYCAYNNEYSCPVPPAENRLTVAIPAGEKSFHE